MTFRSRISGHRPGRRIRDLVCAHRRTEPLIWSERALFAAHFDRVGGYLPGIENVRTVFFDTMTATGRLCFRYASAQPETFSERTGKPDLRSAYGLARPRTLADVASPSAKRRGLNIILIGAMETIVDDFGRITHQLQMEGQRVPREIRGIVDLVITMASIDFGDGKPVRAFVCTSPNPWNYPGEGSQRKARTDREARSRRADRKNPATAGEP